MSQAGRSNLGQQGSPVWTPTSGSDSELSRGILIGAVCWVAFALVAVALQGGVIMDEVAVPGQIMSGLVNYPGGHPHDVFYKTTYSFPNVAGAWFLTLWNNEVVLSAGRNWLFLSLSLVTPFIVTFVLTRRASWAHVAVALTLLEGHLLYGGTYPIRVFPGFYSHGPVGLHMAVLAVALLAGRQWLTGGVLAGMIPAMHAAMAVVVWPWAVVYALLLRTFGDRAAARRAMNGMAIGVLLSVAVVLWLRFASVPLPTGPPYDALGGALEARAGFEAFTDTHRLAPAFVSHAYLLGPVAFLALGYVLLWVTSSGGQERTERLVAGSAIVGLGVLSLAIVYGAWLVQIVFGLPDPVSIAMPYRFTNVVAALLIPMSIATSAAIVKRMEERDQSLMGTLIALAVTAVGVAMSGFVTPYVAVATERVMLPVLFGLPLGLAAWAFGADRTQRWHALLPTGATILAAAALWSGTKAVLLLIGAIIICVTGVWLAQRIAPRVDLPSLRRIRTVATAIAVLVCAFGSVAARRGDFARSRGNDVATMALMSAGDRAIQSWLRANATVDELVLVSLVPRVELQTKTRQPVLFEVETLWLMSYLPSLGPRIGTMARDLYGIDFENAERFARQCPDGILTYWCDVWNAAWRTRTTEQWTELGRKYRFRLVLADSKVEVHLPRVLQAGKVNLYEIPNVDLR